MLERLMSLLHVNDIGENITSHVKLFADDCQLFRTIESVANAVALQNDLCKVSL